MEKLLAEQARLQDAIDAANGWELDRTLEVAMDALRLPPPEAAVTHALRRGEAPGGAVPRFSWRSRTCSSSTSPPTTSTPRAWRGWSKR